MSSETWSKRGMTLFSQNRTFLYWCLKERGWGWGSTPLLPSIHKCPINFNKEDRKKTNTVGAPADSHYLTRSPWSPTPKRPSVPETLTRQRSVHVNRTTLFDLVSTDMDKVGLEFWMETMERQEDSTYGCKKRQETTKQLGRNFGVVIIHGSISLPLIISSRNTSNGWNPFL